MSYGIGKTVIIKQSNKPHVESEHKGIIYCEKYC